MAFAQSHSFDCTDVEPLQVIRITQHSNYDAKDDVHGDKSIYSGSQKVDGTKIVNASKIEHIKIVSYDANLKVMNDFNIQFKVINGMQMMCACVWWWIWYICVWMMKNKMDFECETNGWWKSQIALEKIMWKVWQKMKINFVASSDVDYWSIFVLIA